MKRRRATPEVVAELEKLVPLAAPAPASQPEADWHRREAAARGGAGSATDDPAVGYSVAYPLGVAGPILFLDIMFMELKPKIEAPAGGGLEMLEIAPDDAVIKGKTVGDLLAGLPAGIEIAALRRAHHNMPSTHETALAPNDVLLVTGKSREALEEAARCSATDCHEGHASSTATKFYSLAF
ncbi:TrkA C-terminal domain-containing protein [Variovorax rhizosphaerae]|uniref:TrkA C-terminal domain-containing protein n=1 Tax=Variovorax rhizosphaerae TaxID=1836200 RepID=A0ABU8X0Q5_9BURK